jgi:5-dehydro-2-deoxygluconokinase
MDLYSQDIGAPFEEITGFDTMVGGSPANIAIGVSRLGMSAVLLTAVGDDAVGDFVIRYLRDERVETGFVPRKPGKLTALALIGVQPPSTFPLSFYREDPADIYLDETDVERAPIQSARALQISGNALSRGPCAQATRTALRIGRDANVERFLDLDLRPTEWDDPRSFGTAIREVLPDFDVAIGTEEEFATALLPDHTPNGTLPAPLRAELDDVIKGLGSAAARVTVVKRGERGATVFDGQDRLDVPGFTVEVVNTVGAGDAFAAGLIRSRLLDWNWRDAARFANACGAIVVTRHGCSAAFPSEEEVLAFATESGGL